MKRLNVAVEVKGCDAIENRSSESQKNLKHKPQETQQNQVTTGIKTEKVQQPLNTPIIQRATSQQLQRRNLYLLSQLEGWRLKREIYYAQINRENSTFTN